MRSDARTALFRAPSGRPRTRVLFGGALVLAALAGYGYAVGAPASRWSLAMAVGVALSGLAEALPAGRRRTAGGLRIAAIVLLASLVGAAAFAPEYLV